MNEAEKALERLADVRAAADLLRADYDAKRAALLPPEVVQALADLDAEYEGSLAASYQAVLDAEATVKQIVSVHGATVKAAGLQAVYSAGRVSWDVKALDGYATAHPEIVGFRKVGEPSVSIRVAK